jgi:hypothetical protein
LPGANAHYGVVLVGRDRPIVRGDEVVRLSENAGCRINIG